MTSGRISRLEKPYEVEGRGISFWEASRTSPQDFRRKKRGLLQLKNLGTTVKADRGGNKKKLIQ